MKIERDIYHLSSCINWTLKGEGPSPTEVSCKGPKETKKGSSQSLLSKFNGSTIALGSY